MDTIRSLGTREKLNHIIISRGGLESIRSITGFMGGKLKRNRNGACEACGCEIPPGKAGRKCKECRTKSENEELSECCKSPIVSDYYGDPDVPGCMVSFSVCSQCGSPIVDG